MAEKKAFIKELRYLIDTGHLSPLPPLDAERLRSGTWDDGNPEEKSTDVLPLNWRDAVFNEPQQNRLMTAGSFDEFDNNAAMRMRDVQGQEAYLVPPDRPKIPSPPPHWSVRMTALDAKLNPSFFNRKS